MVHPFTFITILFVICYVSVYHYQYNNQQQFQSSVSTTNSRSLLKQWDNWRCSKDDECNSGMCRQQKCTSGEWKQTCAEESDCKGDLKCNGYCFKAIPREGLCTLGYEYEQCAHPDECIDGRCTKLY